MTKNFRALIPILICLMFFTANISSQNQLRKIKGIDYSEVEITDPFWKPKIEDVAKNAIGVCVYQTETATARIRNFEKVAAKKGERHEGIYYDDSDVYKAIEAMAYSLHSVPDKTVEAKADEWIDKIAAAQLPDGYLNTYFTLEGIDDRWNDMERHEAYCAGHLMEAAIAYKRATGKGKLLDVAIRFADHIDRELRKKNRKWVAGHQEIELALIKLYRETADRKYLELSEWFLEQRGRGYGRGKIWDSWNDPAYCQDALPVKEQTEITGHAVRAMYMYTGIADLAAITQDKEYLETMLTVWEDVVHRNTYVTGGIGSAGRNEGFSVDYDLPNEHAYCETCASVGMVFWNQRMNWLTGNAKYIDVLEKSLYNSALDGISLDGKQFFYTNPLASHGQHERRDWFGTACCPSNISRLITSVGNYIYGKTDDALWINLFVGSKTRQRIGKNYVDIELNTEYPWQNKIELKINANKRSTFEVHIRIPGWSENEAIPGGLYTFSERTREDVVIKVDGKKINFKKDNGYAIVEDKWKNSTITMELPMYPRLIKSRNEILENSDRHALQYGPLIYCFEAIDNGGDVFNVLLPEDVTFERENGMVKDEEIIKLSAQLPVLVPTNDGVRIDATLRKITAIPYYTWCNRGSNDMQVWMPSKIGGVEIR